MVGFMEGHRTALSNKVPRRVPASAADAFDADIVLPFAGA
jgi:hypothetical protein